MSKEYSVYIMASRTKVLYTGVSGNLMERVWQHKNKITKGFTARYNVNKLVYYAQTNDVNEALEFEKRIKGWVRKKKVELIESMNPNWDDLAKDWFE